MDRTTPVPAWRNVFSFLALLLVIVIQAFPGASLARVGTVQPDAVLPDTATGRCAAAFFEAFNSGDDEQAEAFTKRYKTEAALKKRSLKERMRMHHRIREDMGNLKPVEVMEDGGSVLVLEVKDSLAGRSWKFVFTMEKDEPDKLESLMITGPLMGGGGEAMREGVEDRGPAVDADLKRRIVKQVAEVFEANYIFPDVAGKMIERIESRLAEGAYDAVTGIERFASRLEGDLYDVSRDKHISVRPGSRLDWEDEEELTGAQIAKRLEGWRRDNFGFRKVERLPGNIGYLSFVMFADPKYAGPTAVAAMNFLAHSDALIIDLRENHGGSPDMVRLITGYFFDEPKHLNSFYIRRNDSTKQFWTDAHVEGPRMAKTPIYVLISPRTGSGAEEFAYNLRNLKRATLVGETTAGAAHPTEFHRYPELGITVGVPYGRAINPITGDNWEGEGVEPHIRVPSSEALLIARIEATKELLENAEPGPEREELTWMLKGLEAERSPVVLTQEQLETYAGMYASIRVRVVDGGLEIKRPGMEPYKAFPMGEDRFYLKGKEERVRFTRDESGKIAGAEVMFPGGRRFAIPRTG